MEVDMAFKDPSSRRSRGSPPDEEDEVDVDEAEVLVWR
jgi:hypothetical protein